MSGPRGRPRDAESAGYRICRKKTQEKPRNTEITECIQKPRIITSGFHIPDEWRGVQFYNYFFFLDVFVSSLAAFFLIPIFSKKPFFLGAVGTVPPRMLLTWVM